MMKEIPDDIGSIIYLICIFGEILACNYFCRKILGANKLRQIFFVVFLCGIKTPMEVFFNELPYNLNIACYDIFPLLSQFLSIILILTLFGQEMEKRILAAFLLVTLSKLFLNLVNSFLSCAALLFLHVIEDEEIPIINIKAAYSYGMDGASYFACIWGICCLAKYGGSLFNGKGRKWYLVMSIPVFVMLAITDLADWGAGHGILVRSGGNWNLYYDQMFSYMGTVFLSAISIFALVAYLFGMDRLYWEQKKKEQYQIKLMSYQMLEEQYGHMERLRHDFKNHMIALQGMLANKEWEKMNDYFRQMLKTGELESPEEVTGNMAVDALLYQKRKTAEEKGIQWECHMCFLQECPIPAYDLCILLGNALDNAIEACEKVQTQENCMIKVKSEKVKKFFLVEIKNSTDMRCIDEIAGTTKQNPKEHGIGLLNIKDVVKKYNGVMNMELKNQFFILSLLIPLPPLRTQTDAAYDGNRLYKTLS